MLMQHIQSGQPGSNEVIDTWKSVGIYFFLILFACHLNFFVFQIYVFRPKGLVSSDLSELFPFNCIDWAGYLTYGLTPSKLKKRKERKETTLAHKTERFVQYACYSVWQGWKWVLDRKAVIIFIHFCLSSNRLSVKTVITGVTYIA